MIPRFELALSTPEDSDGELLQVSYTEWVEGLFLTDSQYGPQDPVPWREVEAALLAQKAVLADLDRQSTTAAEFEALAEQVSERPDVDEWVYDTDVGTGALVTALSAAGVRTYSSCRGHENSGWEVPFVGFLADRPHLDAIVPLAAAADCRILVRADGRVEVVAEQVTNLHKLASLLVDHREALDRLASVPFSDDD